MAYGTIKVDTVTFTSEGIDTSVSISGLVRNPTFSGNITSTSTISGVTIQGGTLVSGATVTGSAGQFTTITGGTVNFTTITGTTAVITSGVFASGTAAAPSVSIGTTTNGIYSPGADQVAISTAGSERVRIDSSGRLLVGTSSALGVGSTTPASLLIETTTSTLPAAFTRNDVSATGPVLSFGKSRGTTAGSLTAVANADVLGELRFVGADGTTRNSIGAQIQARVDGNPATSDMPGRLVFLTTPSGSAASVERMRIASNGNVSVGTTTSTGTKFLVSASGDGSTSYHGIRVVPVFDSTASTYAASFVSVVDVEDTTWTLPNLDHFVANQSAFGAATVTSQFGFKVNSSLTGATNNYGFFSNIASGTGRWNFYANNTADSYFASNNFIFANGGTERARVDSSGRLLVGTSSSTSIGGNNFLGQFETTQFGVLSTRRNAGGANGPGIALSHSRGATSGSYAALTAQDEFGGIYFYGADGTRDVLGASIVASVDGAPGADDMPGRLVFATTADGAATPTPRMTIASDGKTYIGSGTDSSNASTLNTLYARVLSGTESTATTYCLQAWNTATSGNNSFLSCYTEGSTGILRGGITYNRGGGVVAFNTTSDYRAKTLLGEIENPGATIDAFKVYRGLMNGATVERPMMVAHEAQEVAPYCVNGEKDAVDGDGSPLYQQMDHQVLVPLLIAEIQQLRIRVAALEAA